MPAHSERERFVSARILSLRNLKNAFGLTPGQADQLGALIVEKNTGRVSTDVVRFTGPTLSSRRKPPMRFDSIQDVNGDLTPISEPFVHRRIGRAIGGFIEGGVIGAGRGFFGGGGPNIQPATGCGSGFTRDRNGVCIADRFPIRVGSIGIDPGAFLPGGDPFTGIVPRDVDEFGEAVMGSFGMAAIVPAVVGSIQRRDGTVGNILHCPRGSVLGKDELCYNDIPNKWRKWPKAARPPVSASDAKCIRRAASATKRVERLAKSVGLKTRKR